VLKKFYNEFYINWLNEFFSLGGKCIKNYAKFAFVVKKNAKNVA